MRASARGGARQGKPGQAYGNRTDLNAAKPEPVSTVPNQTYGEAAQQRAAQRAVPLSAPPVAAGGQPAAPSPSLSGLLGSLPSLPSGAPEPGELPWLHPTQRPNEPVTHGLPSGPGAGPEALLGVGAAGFQHASAASLLGALARVPGASDDVIALANYAGGGRA